MLILEAVPTPIQSAGMADTRIWSEVRRFLYSKAEFVIPAIDLRQLSTLTPGRLRDTLMGPAANHGKGSVSTTSETGSTRRMQHCLTKLNTVD